MNFKCVSVLSTEQLMELKKEIEKVLSARREEEAQKIWDNIMANFKALIDIGAHDTMISDSHDLLDAYTMLHNKPEWEFEFDDED